MAENLKSLLIEEAAVRLGLRNERASYFTMLVWIHQRPLVFLQMCGPSASAAGKHVCDNKDITRHFLAKAGLPITDAVTVEASDLHGATEAARRIGYPVVVKPSNLSQGRGVTTGIADSDQLMSAVGRVADLGSRRAVVERHIDAVTDYRFFITRHEVFVTKRVPAHVVGDGRQSVGALLRVKNEQRALNRYCQDYLIPTDEAALTELKAKGLTLAHVPLDGQYVQLRASANISSGGDSIDVTDETHPTFKELARRALFSVPGINYGGVDILATDVTVPPEEVEHYVSEVEFSPAPLSNFPIDGAPRDMAEAVLRHYDLSGDSAIAS